VPLYVIEARARIAGIGYTQDHALATSYASALMMLDSMRDVWNDEEETDHYAIYQTFPDDYEVVDELIYDTLQIFGKDGRLLHPQNVWQFFERIEAIIGVMAWDYLDEIEQRWKYWQTGYPLDNLEEYAEELRSAYP
jgi:hypothetical protein